MASVKDIISSIFRKFENEELSPEFIRDEANEVCDILGISRVGDPGRTAREFAERGFVSKYNGTCKYSPDAINLTLRNEFESYEYVYAYADYESKMQIHSQKKFKDLLVQIKKIIEEDSDKKRQAEQELHLNEALKTSSLVFPLVDENEFAAGLNVEQLLDKLAECLKEIHDRYKVKGYPIFGFRYGHIIAKKNLSINKIVQKASLLSSDIKTSLHTLIRNGVAAFEFASHEGCIGDANVLKVDLDDVDYCSLELEDSPKKNNPSFTPSQIIYYGVPGCGKSNTIKEKLKSVPDFNKVCVVFHPDYTNSEFIGQIRPKIRNHSVTYEFVAGPFAKILRRAYLNPNQEFYLVIDEINRGKASAILGEVFQLCDRIKPNDEKDEFGYGPSWSVYGIDHEDLNDYIRDIRSFANESHDGCDTPVEFSEEDGRGEVSAYKSIDINWLGFGENGKLHFTENTAIRLPPNLSIFATMNTSDQNVFTLDNAFQRRFDMELVCNEFAKGSVDGFKTEAFRNQHDAKIAGTETSWGEFWEWANNKITQVLKGLSSTEDKRLGVWFVCNVNGEIPEKIFAEKVLKYLWDDAFKFKRPQIFAEGCDTLETLISKFHELKFGVFKSFGA
ncbi:MULTISPECIES: AAA family ATPase [unclassified Fibrobacter]|uniref:AAA family ATPase n=1 Tax=unclassified Fibrobacter TaxID=2634177 RepID=UPI00091E6231|nr:MULTISPECIES: AAA family ATPase [unclassified Fibrobacter]OWV02555.1 hypothetical protein B7993_15080 [Fibrobacter sp. UWH3]SHL55786.1 AAA domain (dynein-related subfamily) [Fibrobacter sp. UWH6]